jgi:hypothetical protein
MYEIERNSISEEIHVILVRGYLSFSKFKKNEDIIIVTNFRKFFFGTKYFANQCQMFLTFLKWRGGGGAEPAR